MTDKYLYWSSALANRDQILTALLLFAVSIVVSWIGIDYLPIPATWRVWMRRLFLVGGAFLYLYTLFFTRGTIQQ